MKKLSIVLCLHLSAIAAGLGQSSQSGGASNPTASVPGVIRNGHPAWIIQGNVYEVNVRQYTPSGTFNAFAKQLIRLKQMGVQTLWFMPVNPISVTDRKGSLGSYYAVSDYTTINPEFGTLADFRKLVATIHAMGMKVIIDWVPNHTGADHRWLRDHPDLRARLEEKKKADPAFARARVRHQALPALEAALVLRDLRSPRPAG